jgi:soluble lytic murein transglycosylase
VRSRAATAAALAAAAIVLVASRVPADQNASNGRGDGDPTILRLSPTEHPAVPAALTAMWYAPATGGPLAPVIEGFVRGVRLLDQEQQPARALPLLGAGALSRTPLADHARYYSARALLALERFDEAEAAFAAVAARPIEGHLPEDATLGQAAAREARHDYAGAAALYRSMLERRVSAPHVVLARLAAAAEAAGDTPGAIEALRRVYFGYPLSPEADTADEALTRLNGWSEDESDAALELKRADALFQGRRWEQAHKSYERARSGATGAERQRIVLRIAACDVLLRRYQQAREPLRGLLGGPFGDEAAFYDVAAIRGLGDHEEYVRQARLFADRRRESPFAEETLNTLATHFIVADEDDRADEVFRLIIERYPAGRFSERAYWRSGWWAYRDGRFAEAATLFDQGASRFPRSDYRPSWLFWSGRAWARASRPALATDRLTIAATDYFNSYYGRLAVMHMKALKGSPVPRAVVRQPQMTAPSFPTVDRVALLIATGLNQEALNELEYAERVWGGSPALTATLALVHNRLGHVRPGINAMKRAYPQWMAAGGESLPVEIQQVIFPLEYWPLLRRHAAARGLDPYVVAALVAQESNFDPAVRSSANAIGLMQILPSTGRQVARRLKIPRFSPARLTDPDINVRIGTTIFSEGIRKFGGVHYALAAYNAGDHRVATWQRERPGLPQDEFIDDIPFPETQNYVKRILGTAEDYRRLYRTAASGPSKTQRE